MGGAKHFPWGKYLPQGSKQCPCTLSILASMLTSVLEVTHSSSTHTHTKYFFHSHVMTPHYSSLLKDMHYAKEKKKEGEE
jgi:hypothetical protein